MRKMLDNTQQKNRDKDRGKRNGRKIRKFVINKHDDPVRSSCRRNASPDRQALTLGVWYDVVWLYICTYVPVF